MCKVSDQIKFCTCGPEMDIEELDNYWIFYRRNPHKNEMVIGVTLPPSELDPKDSMISGVIDVTDYCPRLTEKSICVKFVFCVLLGPEYYYCCRD